MRRQIAAVLCSSILGFIASSAVAISQQQSAKAYLESQASSVAILSNARQLNAGQPNAGQRRDGGAADRRSQLSAPQFTLVADTCDVAASDCRIYSTIRDIMDSIVDPSADAIWGAVGTVVDDKGIHDLLPKTQDEWLDLRRAAIRMIEAGNLLMMPGRDAAPAGAGSEAPGVELEPVEITALINGQRMEFDGFAKALQVLALEAQHAIEAKDGALVLDIGARMENVCEGCHQAFWYPAEKRVPGRN